MSKQIVRPGFHKSLNSSCNSGEMSTYRDNRLWMPTNQPDIMLSVTTSTAWYRIPARFVNVATGVYADMFPLVPSLDGAHLFFYDKRKHFTPPHMCTLLDVNHSDPLFRYLHAGKVLKESQAPKQSPSACWKIPTPALLPPRRCNVSGVSTACPKDSEAFLRIRYGAGKFVFPDRKPPKC